MVIILLACWLALTALAWLNGCMDNALFKARCEILEDL